MAVQASATTRTQLKTQIETTYPEFVSALEAAVLKLAAGQIYAEIKLREHKEADGESINSGLGAWLAQANGYEAEANASGKLVISVSPT